MSPLTILLWRLLVVGNNETYFGPHVKCPIFSILSIFGSSRQIFVKVFNIKCYENPSSGSRADTYGRTDVMKLVDAFRQYAIASKKCISC